ncbi:MAG TPA: TIGR04282 family arsenosugar biosynthesis glycosyltransferase [bacterium]|nr:TIGR04282 family arsenosugar biosynthesis glycosyltransferase [bacterium]
MSGYPDRLLIVFAKYPMPGEVKSRLGTYIGRKAACEIYRAFIDTTIEKISEKKRFDIRINFTPDTPEAREYFEHRYTHVPCDPQRGVDIGRRMSVSFDKAFGLGYDQVCIIGTDIPDVPVAHLENAFDLLDENDLVLGDAADGGYYLIGQKENEPALFDGVEWGSAFVYESALKKAREMGLKCASMEKWRDADNDAALLELLNRLNKNEGSSSLEFLKQFLTDIIPGYGSNGV